jgi:hypothetical protein
MPDKTKWKIDTTMAGLRNKKTLQAINTEIRRIRAWAKWVNASIKHGGPIGVGGEPRYP